MARKLGTIARKTKNPGVFGAQFKIIEKGSFINYSSHTAWVREDGKQPRVIRHDGLAFVPNPRIYGKCRPAQLKDFVAYKHLPRAKPRISAAGTQHSKPTAPKVRKQAPKNIEELIRQTMNRKSLGQHIIHKAPSTKSKQQPPKNPPKATKILKSPSRKGKGSPQKVRRDNTLIEFE